MVKLEILNGRSGLMDILFVVKYLMLMMMEKMRLLHQQMVVPIQMN